MSVSFSSEISFTHEEWPKATEVEVELRFSALQMSGRYWRHTTLSLGPLFKSGLPHREAEKLDRVRRQRRRRVAGAVVFFVALIGAASLEMYERYERTTASLNEERALNSSLTDSVSYYRVALDARINRTVALRPRTEERPRFPVAGRISSGFSHSRLNPVLLIWRPHRGVDIPAPSGTPVRSVVPGRVVFVQRSWGWGNVVVVDHGNSIRTRYAHLQRTMVQPGAFVEAGGIIGTVGSTGLSTAPHLHYELLHRGAPVDPTAMSLTVIETVPASYRRPADDTANALDRSP